MWKLFEAENAPGRGVVAFITNRKFLTGHPYAGLRRMMRERFDRIEVIDLRGDARRGERAGVVADQNVFNIMVGTCITIAVADGSRAGKQAELRYTDAWSAGLTLRSAKLEWLEGGAGAGTLSGAVEVARDRLDDMRPGPFEGGAWVSLAECFGFSSSGIETTRDELAYDLSEPLLKRKVDRFIAADELTARTMYRDTRKQAFVIARSRPFTSSKVRQVSYRPLDRRVLFNEVGFVDWPRPQLQAAWQDQNLALFVMPNGTGAGPSTWAHGFIPDRHAFRGSYGGYVFPLFDRRKGGDQINLSPALLAGLAGAYGAPVAPADVFDAILALLSATSYTTTFAEDLEDVFPHVPFPGDYTAFVGAAEIGRKIRAVETFARPPSPEFLTPALARVDTTPSAGPLGAVEWLGDGFALRPDGTGRVKGVPEAVWRFGVSGYRLLPRWLAAREGQPVDKALITAMRDVAGRIAELIHWFDRADLVLNEALSDTLTREELGLSPAEEPASAVPAGDGEAEPTGSSA